MMLTNNYAAQSWPGADPEFGKGGGCTLLKRLKTKKIKYIIIIPITDKLHCLINTAAALLDMTDLDRL